MEFNRENENKIKKELQPFKKLKSIFPINNLL